MAARVCGVDDVLIFWARFGKSRGRIIYSITPGRHDGLMDALPADIINEIAKYASLADMYMAAWPKLAWHPRYAENLSAEQFEWVIANKLSMNWHVIPTAVRLGRFDLIEKAARDCQKRRHIRHLLRHVDCSAALAWAISTDDRGLLEALNKSGMSITPEILVDVKRGSKLYYFVESMTEWRQYRSLINWWPAVSEMIIARDSDARKFAQRCCLISRRRYYWTAYSYVQRSHPWLAL